MGAVDSPLYFQAVLEELFAPLIRENKLLLWIDDILAIARTFHEYLGLLTEIFNICRSKKLKLNVEKCVLGGLNAEWCGRIITSTGVTMKSRKAQGFETMPVPTTAGELGEFLYALNWMRSSLPRFQEKSADLWEIMRKAKQYLLDFSRNKIDTHVKASKKSNYKNVKLDLLGWNSTHIDAFNRIKDSLSSLVELAFFDPNDLKATVCLLTDASQKHYSALLTQVLDWDYTKSVEEQAHEPLASFNGEFAGSAIKWSTIEKESYPIIKALQDYRYMLHTSKGFRLYTDHANLVNLFRPDNLNPPLSTTALDKVYRWLYLLSHFRIISMQHLPGVKNLWADLLSRWGHPTYHKSVDTESIKARIAKIVKDKKRLKRINNEFINLQYSHAHSNFDLPSREKIIAVQQQSKLSIEDKAFLKSNFTKMSTCNGLLYYGDVIWIPASERFLILCLMITSHDSNIGHKNYQSTFDFLRSKFYWAKMRDDIYEFVFHCLSCAKTKTGNIIPRPWGRTITTTTFNQVVHFDYLYIDKAKKSRHDFEYVLVLKDDFTSFVELIPCVHADHINVVNALQSWQSRFGRIGTLVSDQGSHFCNTMMSEYARRSYPAAINHHFTIAYTPWSNGTVERVMRDIIALFRKILINSDTIDIDSWPFALPHVMSVINSRKQVTLGKRSPMELVFGRCVDHSLDIMFDPDQDKLDTILSDSTYDQVYHNLVLSLRDMHKNATLAKDSVRKNNVFSQSYNVPVNFGIGDFVLIAIVNKNARKLQAIWNGPYRVIECKSSHVYVCEDLTYKVKRDVHVTRMKFFASSDLQTTVQLQKTISAQDKWNILYVPEKILDSYVDDSNEIFVRIKWSGFSELETTWEPIKSFYSDCPSLVHEFLLTNRQNHEALSKFVRLKQT
jgi:hypothetical protein